MKNGEEDPPLDPNAYRGGVNARLLAERDAWRALALNNSLLLRQYRTGMWVLLLVGMLGLLICLALEDMPQPNPKVDASVEIPSWWQTRERKPLMEKRRDIGYADTNRCTEMVVWTHLVIHRQISRHPHGHRGGNHRRKPVESWSLYAIGVCANHQECTCPGIHPFLGVPRALLLLLPHLTD